MNQRDSEKSSGKTTERVNGGEVEKRVRDQKKNKKGSKSKRK